MIESLNRDLTRNYLRAQNLSDSEHQIWDYLLDNYQAYPKDLNVPALRPTGPSKKLRPIISADLETDTSANAYDPTPTKITISREISDRKDINSVSVSTADGFASLLFSHHTRGHLIVFWEGAERGFHILLRHFGHLWANQGFKVSVAAAGASIRFIRVRKSKHTWYLCDAQALTGVTEATRASFCRSFCPGMQIDLESTEALRLACSAFQVRLFDLFGTAVSSTLSATAVRVAKQFLGKKQWLWRPDPLSATLARVGGGYRGGFVYAKPYKGPAYLSDMRRAYSWALSQPLPLCSAIGPCEHEGIERMGIYLCRIQGSGLIPIYASRWIGRQRGFVVDHWSGGDFWSILPQSEFAGIRALGYKVDPGWGVVTTSTFSFAPLVSKLYSLAHTHQENSGIQYMTKAIANSVYGKFSESPQRTDVMYSQGDPGKSWDVFLTDEGMEVPGLWTRSYEAYRAHQHINIAAMLTGYVRSRVYEVIASTYAQGGQVVAADTDSVVTTIDPFSFDPEESDAFGTWRLVKRSAMGIVARSRAYTIGDITKVAGVTQPSPQVVEVLYANGEVRVGGHKKSVPWRGNAFSSGYVQTLRRA